MTTVSIHIVTWNSAGVIPICLGGVTQQDYPDFQVIVVDNDSQDGTIEYIRQNYPEIEIIQNNRNMGFSKAHNQAIQRSSADFILVLNPDVYLCPGFLGSAVAALEKNETFGAAAPRIYVASQIEFDRRAFSSKPLLDCAGLNMLKSRRLVLRGHYQEDNPEFDHPAEVFGADGAAPLYRRAMLEDIKYRDEYFDEDFFAYKEDHDLAWRARWMGWKTIYVPEAKAYHVRATRPGQRSEMKTENRILGIRNRYLMMRKNDSASLMARHLISILFYECKILFYVALFERESWPAYLQAWRSLDRMNAKRQLLMSRRRISNQEMSPWFI